MKKTAALLLALACILGLTACGAGTPAESADSQEISSVATANGFVLTLYADRASYSEEEEICLRATLEYTGKGDTVTIWHGEPYITFSITDGESFETGGLIMTILTSTELEKGKIYEFVYSKSGGYSEDDPDADFWRAFYEEEALKLPAGTYTVTVSGAFYLSERQLPEEKGPACSLTITVTE